ncbi:MAG: hypothetical protein ACKVYV_03700 [Limisphaerales bacterium]
MTCRWFCLGAALLWTAALSLCGQPFTLQFTAPALDRWVYFAGDLDGARPAASTWGSFDPRFDTRDGQFLLGWDTATLVPTNAGPARYLLRRARLTLTVTQADKFAYDPTHDGFETYSTNTPAYRPDDDPGRPVELFGAGFRGGYTAASFLEDSPYGQVNPFTSSNITIATRHAYAAAFDTNGALVDISNHVGQRNAGWTQPEFEVRPWAVGQTTNAAPGELVPDDARFTFEVDLADPLVAGALQRALHEGRLRLVVSSLHPAGQVGGPVGGGGQGSFPLWATKENLVYDPPHLELDGRVMRDTDTDGDGLPDDWEDFHFGDLADGATDDYDQDGAGNGEEFRAGTNPDDAASRFMITRQARAEGLLTVEFTTAPSRVYSLRASPDLETWRAVTATLTFPQAGVGRFTAADAVLPATVFLAVEAEPVP